MVICSPRNPSALEENRARRGGRPAVDHVVDFSGVHGHRGPVGSEFVYPIAQNARKCGLRIGGHIGAFLEIGGSDGAKSIGGVRFFAEFLPLFVFPILNLGLGHGSAFHGFCFQSAGAWVNADV